MQKRWDFLKLTVPLILQALLSALINATDTVMLGRVNQQALSAVTLACQLSQIFVFYLNAICIGSTALSSQYDGNHDLDSVRKVSIITYQFSLGGGFLFFLISMLIPGAVMKLFTNDPELIPLGISYLRIVSLSFLFMSISQVRLNIMKNTGKAKVSAIFGSIAVILNITLNFLLIYGSFGFPTLGIRGAALATTISRGVELLLILLFARDSNLLKGIPFRNHLKLYRGLMRKFIRYTMPSVIQGCSWMIASSLTVAVLGHLDSNILAASSVALIFYNIASSFVMGSYATATGITLGHLLGEGSIQKAKHIGDHLLKGAALIGALVGTLIILFGPYAMPVFNTLTDEARVYLQAMILMIGIKCVGKFVNATLAFGIFSSGGDILYLMKLDFINMWLVILPASVLSAFVLHLPPLVVYAIINMDEYSKIAVMLKRYRTYAWARNLTTKDWAPPGRYDRQIRQKIIEEMPMGVMVISHAGRVILANDACSTYLGLEKDRIEGSNYTALFLTEDHRFDTLADLLIDTMNHKTVPGEQDIVYKEKDTEQRFHVRVSYMEDEDCRIGLCVMFS